MSYPGVRKRINQVRTNAKVARQNGLNPQRVILSTEEKKPMGKRFTIAEIRIINEAKGDRNFITKKQAEELAKVIKGKTATQIYMKSYHMHHRLSNSVKKTTKQHTIQPTVVNKFTVPSWFLIAMTACAVALVIVLAVR